MESKKINHKVEPVRMTPFVTKSYFYTKEDADIVAKTVLSGKLTHSSGEETKKLESEFAQYCGTQFALATNSGTSALQLAVKAAGIGLGDEVILPAYTFIATAQAILSQGGVPVFADLDDTFCISPKSVKKLITKKTKAIIVVHIFGNVADVDSLKKIIGKKKITIIEDCAQAIGATCNDKKVGNLGDIGCFSFNEKKALPTGQGGMFTTSDNKLYRIAAATRNTGIDKSVSSNEINTAGNTLFMTEMEAVLARAILKKLDKLNRARRINYDHLQNCLKNYRNKFKMYSIAKGANPSFSRIVFLVNFKKLGITRDSFIEAVNKEGIPLRIFYPIPLYKYRLFQEKRDAFVDNSFAFAKNKENYRRVSLPYAERFCEQQVGLEFSPYITKKDVEDVLTALSKVITNMAN